MSLSSPFIHRPVATTLLTLAIALAGAVAFMFLPVAPLPQIDFPTITVAASLPGASSEIMASSVATPLERQFGRIAGVTEMTSASYLGSTGITLQFDLSRNIDGAARDVQAAINAARSYLPTNLPSNPTYRKVNPADAPIMILALTSDILDRGELYDAASTIMQPAFPGAGRGRSDCGREFAAGGARGDQSYAIEQLRSRPSRCEQLVEGAKFKFAQGRYLYNRTDASILANDQLLKAENYKPLIVGYHNGDVVKLSDVANVVDSVENIRAAGFVNGKPSVLLILFRQPGANIIDTVAHIREAIPSLKASIPASIDLTTVLDRTTTIRASVHEVETTLLISVVLVILVVFFFLRNVRATLIPSVAVPVSLIGTFGAMYLCGYSLDNLSLMALTIATGFVVDDAIVVIENIARYLEQGMRPMQAALVGAREIGFTVLSISMSLVAVFIPILLMGGIVGRLFREFAVTLSVAILVSLLISLTATPMMCSRLLRMSAGRAWPILPGQRGPDELADAELREGAAIGAAASRVHAGGLICHDRRQRVLAGYRPEGFFPRAGQRHDLRRGTGTAGCVVSNDAESHSAFRKHHEERSGGRERNGLYRRNGPDQQRFRLRFTEAAESTQVQFEPDHQPFTAQARDRPEP